MKKIVLGILAHVDAGKTTLSESILYQTGQIREAGRVDHGNAFLDTSPLEKSRGITIFSKQAVFTLEDTSITLLDTPGHVDFSAEMERVLQVLDYAVLVISAADGVQGHTETLWHLLERHRIPTFLFVNKMDQPGADPSRLLDELKKHLSAAVTDFTDCSSPEWIENAAASDEHLLEQYFQQGESAVTDEAVRTLIRKRRIFPLYFGSALRMQGIQEFLQGFSRFTQVPEASPLPAARIFKVTRDEQGNRLVHLKVTGGSFKNRDELPGGEKITQLRIYSGARYEAVDSVSAGDVAALTGSQLLKAGDILGNEAPGQELMLEPVLDYQVTSPEADTTLLFQKLQFLSDEFPELHLRFDSALREIHLHLMGAVQTEILQNIVQERQGISLHFSTGKILYQETIPDAREGAGHFEPLRHYAEVRLLLEPLPRGSGLVFAADCPDEILEKKWQRLILQHLREREYPGVLTGAPITDLRITVIGGRAHLKHTEGGDFREASIRALRQGLRRRPCTLLEPFYSFSLELPREMLGKALTDLDQMSARFSQPEISGETASVQGRAPVRLLQNYQQELAAYSRGRGKLFLIPDGYDVCQAPEAVLRESSYDPDQDLQNPCGSVFCAHGAGFFVPFDQVEQYMHTPSPRSSGISSSQVLPASAASAGTGSGFGSASGAEDSAYRASGHYIGDAELEEIFIRTYGPIRNRSGEAAVSAAKTVHAAPEKSPAVSAPSAPVKQYLLVDGYNISFAWEELRELAARNLDGARIRLQDILSNYAGFTRKEVILVFDAYRVQGHAVEQLRYHNIDVVFTREAQTADQYIEELSHSLSRRDLVTVATSDRVVQVITWSGTSVSILSAQDLEEEVQRNNKAISETLSDRESFFSNRPIQLQPEDGTADS